MKRQFRFHTALGAASILALGVLLLPSLARAQAISKTAQAGPYEVTLKMLPTETFGKANGDMARSGGARAMKLDSPNHPNHHLVVFVTEGGKPVETAKVIIRYRETSAVGGPWKMLPVARMYEAGKGRTTTHYGNNVHLTPGTYDVRVTVNGKGPSTFHFMLSD